MPAGTPTILATSGGLFPDPRTFGRPAPLLDYLLELARPAATPRLCFVNTAGGDQAWWNATMHAAYYEREVVVSCLDLFPMPNVSDPAAHFAHRMRYGSEGAAPRTSSRCGGFTASTGRYATAGRRG